LLAGFCAPKENRKKTTNTLLMGKQKKGKKGQIWSLDFISGITLMSLLIMLFILEWNYLSIRWNTSSGYREMFGGALYAAEALFTTAGNPAGWERLAAPDEDNLLSIGLVNSRNELDNQKLEKLAALNSSADYELVRTKLGIPGYQLHLNISDLEGNITHFEYGIASELNNSVVVERFVLLNDTVAKARMEVWR
jgi:hypothetical protein